MVQKYPDDLRRFAIEVAQKTRKPFDDIFLRKTKTKQETQEYVETEKYPINCWILEKYTEEDVDGYYYFTVYSFYYVLKSNGDLNVITVRSNEVHSGNIFYKDSSATIEDMTFLTPTNFETPIVRVSLFSLLDRKSAYQLDVAHCNWKVDKGNGDYIQRNYPIVLRSEGYTDGAGEYKYNEGEGLVARLEMLLDLPLSQYLKLAVQSNASAQSMLGNCYFHGKGLEKNYNEAINWYTKAAIQGDADAQCALGECYQYGYGLAQDHNKAMEWLEKAVDQGNEYAKVELEKLK